MTSWREVCSRMYDDREEWGMGDYYKLVEERNRLARFAELLVWEYQCASPYLVGEADGNVDRLWREAGKGDTDAK